MAKRILVVDDEPDILKVLLFRLRKLGCEVTSTTSGVEALELIWRLKPDLIILDYRLPDIDGLQVAAKVRADDAVKATPIILISASSGGDIHDLAAGSGVNEYIIKPFEPDELIAAAKKYL